MPSIDAGSCLDRHEWYKHGTCAVPWTAQEYFHLAAALVKEFNDAGMAQIMADNLGRSVKERTFRKAIDRAFGEGAAQRVKLECSNKMLVGVAISLPQDLDRTATLKDVILEGQKRSGSNCNGRFQIDRAGH
jgi:ribonuclease T2